MDPLPIIFGKRSHTLLRIFLTYAIYKPGHGSSDSVKIRKSSIDVVGGEEDFGFRPPDDDL